MNGIHGPNDEVDLWDNPTDVKYREHADDDYNTATAEEATDDGYQMDDAACDCAE